MSKAITKPEPNNLAAVPEHLRSYAGQQLGLEQADKSDYILPRLAMSQDLSPQTKKSRPEYIQGLKVGEFFNTVSKQIYGTSVEVVPLFLTKNRIKFKKPVGSGIDCQSPNGKTGGRISPQSCAACPHSSFGPAGEKPECDEFKNLVCLMSTGELIVVSAKSSTIKVMKQWLSMIRMTNLPTFAFRYRLQVVEETRNGNTYGQLAFERLGHTPEKMFSQAETFFQGLRDKDIQVDTTGQDDDAFDTDTM